MKTPRQGYNIDISNPGSNIAGETSTTMEASYYSNELLSHAK